MIRRDELTGCVFLPLELHGFGREAAAIFHCGQLSLAIPGSSCGAGSVSDVCVTQLLLDCRRRVDQELRTLADYLSFIAALSHQKESRDR